MLLALLISAVYFKRERDWEGEREKKKKGREREEKKKERDREETSCKSLYYYYVWVNYAPSTGLNLLSKLREAGQNCTETDTTREARV